MLSPAWNDAIEKIASRRSSPILMPVAVETIVGLAEGGKITAGRVAWREFEAAYATAMASHDASKQKEAWRPFYHLSGNVGLWTLWKGEAVADFADLRKGKPASASSLGARVDHARLPGELQKDLESPEGRAAIRSRLGTLFADQK